MAARQLFAAHGYAGTSMARIAEAAGVSVQTIYDSIGSKAAIVGHLSDLIDEEGGVGPLVGRIPEIEDPRQLLDVAVSIAHNLHERCGDIAGVIFGPAPEPGLLALRTEGLARHRGGCVRLAGRLASLGALREGLTVEEAGDIIATLTHPETVRTMVLEYGWTWDRWHEWAVDALAGLVLAGP